MPTFARTQLLAQIGHGTTGKVWRASTEAGHVRAVKILREDLSDNQQVRQRLFQEAHLLTGRRLPHIVGVHRVLTSGQQLALELDHIAGPNLRDYLREHSRLAPAQACAIAAGAATALSAAHSLGIVHRDLKPENIVLGQPSTPGELTHTDAYLAQLPHPCAYVTDFGVAKALHHPGLTQHGQALGTPTYMAPELLDGRPVTSAADVYSLGVLLYEMLTGWPPCSAETVYAVLSYHRTGSLHRPDGLPDPVWSLLTHLLAPLPDQRPPAATTTQALCALVTLVADAPALPARPAPHAQAEALTLHEGTTFRRRRRHRAAATQ